MRAPRSALLVAITCCLAAQRARATDFQEIQLWFSSGWTRPSGFSALADGTLAVVKLNDANHLQHGVCARATRKDLALLTHLVDQIPGTAPWGRQLWLQGACSDAAAATLLVSTARGELDVKHSLACKSAKVPSWVTKLSDAMRQLQDKHVACRE